MKNLKRTSQEQVAVTQLLAFVEKDLGDQSAKVVAGALMRASVALAQEVFGPEAGSNAAQRALANILTEKNGRTLQ